MKQHVAHVRQKGWLLRPTDDWSICVRGRPFRFTAQYIQKAPEGLGPIVGSGVAYYFGPEAERRVSSLAIDMSAAVLGALFIKASVIYDGATLPMAQSLSAARDYIFKMLAGIHLEPGWE
jgi:hypothetical protein